MNHFEYLTETYLLNEVCTEAGAVVVAPLVGEVAALLPSSVFFSSLLLLKQTRNERAGNAN